jgi:hypothetical protein
LGVADQHGVSCAVEVEFAAKETRVVVSVKDDSTKKVAFLDFKREGGTGLGQ